MDIENYFLPLRKAFDAHADPEAAVFMQKYLKGNFSFYGLASPLRRQLQKEFYAEFGTPLVTHLEDIIHYCWNAEQREWQYAAMELALRFARKTDEQMLHYAEYMITHKAWWDSVDMVAVNIAGAVLREHPEFIMPYTGRWMASQHLWLMRSALLFQLKYKNDTDTELLFRYILECAGSREFFLRKAIGWSLREYSKTNPGIVRIFVETHQLSPLSRKEALKIISKGLHDQTD